MSQRVKKPGRSEESQGKRRRRRPSGSDADEDGTRSGSNSGGNGSLSGMWTPRHLSDLKVSSIYNRNSAEAPAELYRKDLISAMKLADSEPLTPEEYWLITDPWKQEWEKGVQVPVNPESLPEPEVVVISPVADRSHDFRLPKKKYVRVTHDDFFNPDYHQLVSTAARAEKVCSYDLDDVDAAWLGCCNADRGMQTSPVISEFLMEQVIEELELQCWEQVQTILKSQEGLGIEYDENVICDVCRSPESEEGNEMVFCDSCNICVHQACYGITTIPSGSWLCRTCTLGIRPSCVLCPNIGGAMKATRSGHKWAHVACAIWIPEVSIGSVEKMEPITKISSIPTSRWALACVLCKEKVGACIQCSVKTCKTAYHVTCAFKNGLEMKPIIVDENAEDGIKLRSYCEKHSVNTKKDKSANSGSEEDGEKKKARAMTAEERNQARAEKLQQIEAEFYKYVRLKDVSQNLAVDMDIVNLIYNYWKLKRKSLNNRPLVPPRPETTQLLTQQQEQDLEQMKMFVQLRQDLERVRNLCYMVSRREKLSRTFIRLREQTFQKQASLFNDKTVDLLSIAPAEKAAILDANHGPSIYDKCYSHSGVSVNYKDYDTLVNLIMGDEKKDILNGVLKTSSKGKKSEGNNPYKKTFVNGARRRNPFGDSCSSVSESESILSAAEDGLKSDNGPNTRKPLSYLFDSDSSLTSVGNLKKGTTSSTTTKAAPNKGRGLKQMEKMLEKSSTSDSELDMPASAKTTGNRGNMRKRENVPIYSDTESEASEMNMNGNASNAVATKGALKEFTAKKNAANSTKEKQVLSASGKGRTPRRKGTTTGKRKKGSFDPTELIVPQREAAKKATESIRSVKSRGQPGAPGDAPESPGSVTPGGSVSKDSVVPSVPPKSNKPLKDTKNEILGDTEKERVKTKKVGGKSPERKSSSGGKKASKSAAGNSAATKVDDPVKDEYDFDSMDGENSSKSVSYVPQRQAAKKAAEHIRSGLSNIVAARLIIEDEMEAARKKAKGEKVSKKGVPESPSASGTVSVLGKASKSRSKSPFRELFEETNDVDDNPSSPKSKPVKDRPLVKGGDLARAGGKAGKKEPVKAVAKGVAKEKDTDWPFLDKGSQSACRRSRERSSSSSSASSSGSSSSGSSSSSRSSSSSSRSSSPESASPEPNPVTTRKSPILSEPIKSSQVGSTSAGPGRKLKTSERVPNSRLRSETPPRAKPPAKSRGPKKPGPRRSSVASPRASSREPSPKRSGGHGVRSDAAESGLEDSKPRKLGTGARRSSNGKTTGSRRRPSVSPTRNTVSGKARSQEKSPGRARESKVSETTSKERSPSRSNFRTQASPKTLNNDLELSSDTDPENVSRKMTGKHKSSKSSSHGSDVRAKPMPKAKKKELGLASNSDNSEAEEKENSCMVSSVSVNSPKDSPKKVQKQSVPVTSVMSPLTPSSDNKEKELNLSRASDTEPEAKRPRLDPTVAASTESSVTTTVATPCSSSSILSVSSSTAATVTTTVPTSSPLPSSLLGTPTPIPPATKSIFSPPNAGRADSDLLDFDSDLYDLARSVTEECNKDDGVQSDGSLSFSFAPEFLCREENKEDSARATLSLVEKLRLQHARKSGTAHRPSVESSSEDALHDDRTKSPVEMKEETSVSSVTSQDRSSGVEPPAKSPAVISVENLDKSKSIQGDERWVPPGSEAAHVNSPLQSQAEQQHSPAFPLPPSQQSSMKVPVGPSSHPKISAIPARPVEVDERKDIPPQSPLVITHEHQAVLQKHDGLPMLQQSLLQQQQQAVLHPMQEHHPPVPHQSLHQQPQQNLLGQEKVKEESIPIEANNFVAAANDGVFGPGVHGRQFPQSPASGLGTTVVTSNGLLSPSSSHSNVSVSQLPFSTGSASTPVPPGYPPAFLYPPALANVVGQFFHPSAQTSIPKTSPPIVPGSQPTAQSSGTGYPPAFPLHFASSSQQQQGKVSPICSPPLSSPGSSIMPPRRPSDNIMDVTKVPLGLPNSLVSAVASAMPPLSKPPLSSPSILLSASNVKTMTPTPPPLSTVAQIIESVVNNHSAATAAAAAAAAAVAASNQAKQLQNSTNSGNNSHLSAPTTSSAAKLLNSATTNTSSSIGSTKTGVTPQASPLAGAKITDNTDFSAAILSNKTENIIPPKLPNARDSHNVVPATNTVSPKAGGRGKRPSTPRAKVEKVVIEEASPKSRGRGERKSNSSTSPGRGGTHKPATPRRAQSRGRGKNKNVVGVRKDLAGTVYDIDFDEFEENSEEKFDLRMLRERRKSSDVYSEAKKSESTNASPAQLEKNSPRYRNTFDSNCESHNSRSFEKGLPMLQAPLPGPVDMRTYSAAEANVAHVTNNNTAPSFPQSKDPSAADFASLFMSNSTSASTGMNDLEELDKTLEALVSHTPEVSAATSTAPTSSVPSSYNQSSLSSNNSTQKNTQAGVVVPGSEYSLSRDSDMPSVNCAPSEGDSRNQLKVKIKGPFLDANYSSHSIAPPMSGVSNYAQPLHHHHHHHVDPPHPMMMNAPSIMNSTSTLRRMRKKELLRQYWTQDMNMDGSSMNTPYGPDMGFPANPMMAHPINRSVITIPKAVASMAIIPTKDDYRLDNLSSDEQMPTTPTHPSQINSFGNVSAAPPAEKKRRSRGVREIAALGILPPDAPRERRRERVPPSASSVTPTSVDANARKRGRNSSNKPKRGTFIPPTLVESEEANAGANGSSSSTSANNSSNNRTTSKTTPKTNAISSSVVNAVSHPTPKLKIKFGSEQTSVNPINNTQQPQGVAAASQGQLSGALSDSDKETPSKKAKGRPPKKRGIAAEISQQPVPPTMEELKRQSLQFREMVMKEFDVAEKREILSLTGTRRHKKSHKNKVKRSGDSGTDESVRSKSPDVKVVTEIPAGPKLILRFKSRPTAANPRPSDKDTNKSDGSTSNANNSGTGISQEAPRKDEPSTSLSEPKENGPVLPGAGGDLRSSGGDLGQKFGFAPLPLNVDVEMAENDSGFTGSSEGSNGGYSAMHEVSIKDKPPIYTSSKTDIGNDTPAAFIPSQMNSVVTKTCASPPGTSSNLNNTNNIFNNNNNDNNVSREPSSEVNISSSAASNCPTSLAGSGSATSVPINSNSETTNSKQFEKIMPIRLKLSRCCEGAGSWKKSDQDREKGNPNQSDSCEVR